MKILFPTDFSKAADHAFIYALKVADKIGGEITTVHVYDVPHVRAAHLRHTMSKVYDSIALEQFENYKDHIPHLREIATKKQYGAHSCQPCDGRDIEAWYRSNYCQHRSKSQG